MANLKPLGGKAYGSIPHLPESRTGPGDHCVPPEQASLLTSDTRSPTREVVVQEKLDGSCVAVLRTENAVIPLTRSGYPAITSPYEMHIMFDRWVQERADKFMRILDPGERMVGEWLAQAHGTRYDLQTRAEDLGLSPADVVFVPFDIMEGSHRRVCREVYDRCQTDFVMPKILHCGGALPVDAADALLRPHGYHRAIDEAEGVVYRMEDVEKHRAKDGPRRVVLVAKYVRPGKVDGKYLPEIGFNEENFHEEVWNWRPDEE